MVMVKETLTLIKKQHNRKTQPWRNAYVLNIIITFLVDVGLCQGREKNWLAKKNSLFPFINIGKTMEDIIETVTSRRELRVVEYLQCGRNHADVTYLTSHLIIKKHVYSFFLVFFFLPETVRKLRTRDRQLLENCRPEILCNFLKSHIYNKW